MNCTIYCYESGGHDFVAAFLPTRDSETAPKVEIQDSGVLARHFRAAIGHSQDLITLVVIDVSELEVSLFGSPCKLLPTQSRIYHTHIGTDK